MIKRVIIGLIKLYQKTLSPDHGFFKAGRPYGFCKYYPSCSEYAKQSIEKKGIFEGLYRSVIRIIKCNPFSQGGVDLP